MSPTSRTSALTDIRLASGALQSYPSLRLAQRILVALNLLSESVKMWVPKNPTDGPLKQNKTIAYLILIYRYGQQLGDV